MYTEQLLHIGEIAEVFPAKREIRISTDHQLSATSGDPIFIELDSSPIPYFIAKIEEFKNGYRVALDEPPTINDLEKIKHLSVFIETKFISLDQETKVKSIIGFKVIDELLGEIGTVGSIDKLPAQKLIVVNTKTKTILVPWVNEIVRNINNSLQQVEVCLPDGLMDVN